MSEILSLFIINFPSFRANQTTKVGLTLHNVMQGCMFLFFCHLFRRGALRVENIVIKHHKRRKFLFLKNKETGILKTGREHWLLVDILGRSSTLLTSSFNVFYYFEILSL